MPRPHRDDEEELKRVNVFCLHRTIYFMDSVDSSSVSEAIRWLDLLEKNSKQPIEIVLCSAGGECYAGLALYDRIRHSKCPICIVGTGCCMSMGFIIFLAGKYRYLFPNCILLNHQISSGQQGRLEDLKIELEECKRIEQQCLEIISERTGQTIKAIAKSIEKGNRYITPEQALKEGIAHKIIGYEKN